MSTQDLSQNHQATFDSIKHFDEQGNEYWQARQLAKILEYSEYRHFLPVISRAKEACRNSGIDAADHFEDYLDMVEIGSGAMRELSDIRLSRYACYLIVQNGDPKKEELIVPLWSLKKFIIMNEIDKEMIRKKYYQGIKFKVI